MHVTLALKTLFASSVNHTDVNMTIQFIEMSYHHHNSLTGLCYENKLCDYYSPSLPTTQFIHYRMIECYNMIHSEWLGPCYKA